MSLLQTTTKGAILSEITMLSQRLPQCLNRCLVHPKEVYNERAESMAENEMQVCKFSASKVTTEFANERLQARQGTRRVFTSLRETIGGLFVSLQCT